jgi:type IV pilus biogenesis protein CpaD/CtpE
MEKPMTDISPDPPVKPVSALQSLTLRGAAAMAVAFAAHQGHIQLPDGAAQEIANALIQLVFYGGLIAVGVGRARARGPLV